VKSSVPASRQTIATWPQAFSESVADSSTAARIVSRTAS
jgi:hypothetical protein